MIVRLASEYVRTKDGRAKEEVLGKSGCAISLACVRRAASSQHGGQDSRFPHLARSSPDHLPTPSPRRPAPYLCPFGRSSGAIPAPERPLPSSFLSPSSQSGVPGSAAPACSVRLRVCLYSALGGTPRRLVWLDQPTSQQPPKWKPAGQAPDLRSSHAACWVSSRPCSLLSIRLSTDQLRPHRRMRTEWRVSERGRGWVCGGTRV